MPSQHSQRLIQHVSLLSFPSLTSHTKITSNILKGDSVTAGILSQLEIFTALVACCVATWRPLVDRLFGTSAKLSKGQTADTGGISSRRRGWDKINIRHDVLLESHSIERSISDDQTPEGSENFELRDAASSTIVHGHRYPVKASPWTCAQSQNWSAQVSSQHNC